MGPARSYPEGEHKMSKYVTVIFGRDGMGLDATEKDFDSWVSYVCEHIDATTDKNVQVETRGKRDVQDDQYVGDYDNDVHNAVQVLWERWCAVG
jgi:hypothetical protein